MVEYKWKLYYPPVDQEIRCKYARRNRTANCRKKYTKEIKTELTYKDLDIPEYGDTDKGRNNLWSILYTTGYLTTKSCDGKIYELIIPNREIHDIFCYTD